MIDCINTLLTLQGRKDIVNRALYTNPYFYKLHFPIEAGTPKPREYQQNVGINRDFYLTEVMSNFGEVFTDSGSLFNITVYSEYLRSLYRYNASTLLPNSFFTQEARLRTPYAQQKFDDRQHEIFPTLIRNNDRIFAEIQNLSTKTGAADAYIVLKGFNTNNEVYIPPSEMKLLNNSLAQESRFQFFSFNVNGEGLHNKVKQNDNTPRLVLAFGITNRSNNKTIASNATISIRDNSRRINLTDTNIPIQFIAPRLVNARDINRFYLPIEHYWPPLGQLEFNINNNIVDPGDTGFQFSILTRTV
jgi:hypothetical protein